MISAATHALAPGSPVSLGAESRGDWTNFAVYSAHAGAVELCLFDDSGEETTIPIEHETNNVWHVAVAGLAAGQRYGFRVHGPWAPDRGLCFNPRKLLVDPYARAIAGSVDWDGPMYGFIESYPSGELLRDDRDNAAWMPKGVLVGKSEFDWQGDALPNTAWNDTIIYELHVKGFTQLHPDIPNVLRGTYAGLAHPAAILHLLRLGVTAVELLPVHSFVDDHFLVEKRLRNYWGYNTLGFFAPESRYSHLGDRGGQIASFKEMVRALHAAGIEVILDVVFNHTAEAGDFGPTLSFRGIDNTTYYHLSPELPRRNVDWTGTGNTMNLAHPAVLRLVMDSLRYWIGEMHVDGFRFDLASALGRDENGFSARAAFFAAVHQDPVVNKVKLIAEPWDIGAGGYRLGHFPTGWSEWNDRYRDTVRAYWLGKEHRLGEIGDRLSGSADLFRAVGRQPTASINFVTAHDGFTLADLVSYQSKHNDANGEDNRDGSNHELSNNFGIEGPTDNARVNAARLRERKNLLATLLASIGVPMLTAGDEIGRTQRGNNNAYAQDNRVSWLDWDLDDDQRSMLDFVTNLTRLRHELGPLRRARHVTGVHHDGAAGPDLAWFRADGVEMRWFDWIHPAEPAFSFRLLGESEADLKRAGSELQGCCVVFNSGEMEIDCTLPPLPEGGWCWKCALSSATLTKWRGAAPERSVTIFVLRSDRGEGQPS